LVYPRPWLAPPPDPGLQGDVLDDYIEAAQVLALSPKAAGALLRLAIERLVQSVLGRKAGLNEGIGELVSNHNLPVLVQQALDVVRVVGNDAVHPGQIDPGDHEAAVLELFELVNYVALYTITMPAQIQATYDNLPESKRDQIERRDRPDT